MTQRKIKPATGVKVRDPRNGAHLAEDGEEKPMDRYWLRRLRDGDVVPVETTAKTKAAKAAARKE